MRKYKNLNSYLTKKINRGIINYFDFKFVFNESGKKIAIIWNIDFESSIHYNIKLNLWTVKFFDEPPLFKKIYGLPMGESFDCRGINYKYKKYGFKLLYQQDLTVALSSKKIEKIIKFTLYYGFKVKPVKM